MMFKPLPRDILLLACRVITCVLLAVFGLVWLLVAGLTAYGAFANPGLTARMAGMTALSLLMIAVAFRFIQLLGRIIDSVAESDPFTLLNSGRLQQMAWLALAFQLLALAAHARGGDLRVIHINGVEVLFSTAGGISFAGLLLALVLLVLARVFRQGAGMREKLDGTV